MAARRIYDHPSWKRTRAFVLERDKFICQVRRDGCTEVATCVDHVFPVLAGGAAFDPANCRASCAFCNGSRVRREGFKDQSYGLSDVWS